MKIKTIIISGLFLSSLTLAKDESEKKYNWSGSKGYLGFSASSGNSDIESLTAGLRLKLETGKWISTMDLDILRASSNGIDTAESYTLNNSTGYKLNEKNYLYYGSRYQKDSFSAFDYTTTSNVGWGHKFFDTNKKKLITETGIGYKTEAFDIDRSRNTGLVLTGKMDYMRQLTDTMKFVDVLLIEATSDNTFLQNDAGFSLKVNNKANVNFVYQVKHNTDVPDNFKSTDSLFTVNLSYDF